MVRVVRTGALDEPLFGGRRVQRFVAGVEAGAHRRPGGTGSLCSPQVIGIADAAGGKNGCRVHGIGDRRQERPQRLVVASVTARLGALGDDHVGAGRHRLDRFVDGLHLADRHRARAEQDGDVGCWVAE